MVPTASPIRVVIADDHPILRDGLRRLLETEPEFVVVGQAADTDEAVASVQQLQPDVLLLDLSMPGGGGLDVLRALKGLESKVKTILLTAAIAREETIEALELGARGIVLKESATKFLYRCLKSVVAGEYWVGHNCVNDILQTLSSRQRETPTPASQLTPRELQIIAAIVGGASNREISQDLSLSEQTVKNHLSHIFDKVGVSSRLELALYATHHHLLARVPPQPDRLPRP